MNLALWVCACFAGFSFCILGDSYFGFADFVLFWWFCCFVFAWVGFQAYFGDLACLMVSGFWFEFWCVCVCLCLCLFVCVYVTR